MNKPGAWTSAHIPDQQGRTFVVTGSNTGIGLATVSALAAKHARVVLACRTLEKGLAARDRIRAQQRDADVEVMPLDLASLASVREFAQRCGQDLPYLDGLINNAGVMHVPFGRTAEGFEMHFGTNMLGHFALTGWLLPLLEKAPRSRVVTLSSLGHWYARIDFDNLNAEKGYDKAKAYVQSKLANLVFAYELQRRLARAGSSTQSMGAHPGVTQSELGRNEGYVALTLRYYGQSAHDGALTALRAAIDPGVVGGSYVGPGGFLSFKGPPTVQKSRRLSYDPELGAKLWDVAQRLTGVHYL